ncbi:MAG: efflux RND transporter periplasmic adaptor subunit, partial [Alphaproteobacteria bacterium]
MSLLKQITISASLILVAALGWYLFADRIFPSDEAATARPTPGQGGPAATGNRPRARSDGQAPNRQSQGERGQAGQDESQQARAGRQAPAPGAAGQQRGRNAAGPRAGGAGGFSRGATLVVAAPVDLDASGFEVRAVGTAEAVQAVTVFPEVSGMVEEIVFASGSVVQRGDPLVRLNSADQAIARDRARLALGTASEALGRAEQLAQSNNITTVALADARAAVRRAEIDVREAELDFANRTIRAPFAGTVGMTDLTPGDLVSSARAIATLDDLSSITVDFTVPERASGLVAVEHELAATAEALPGVKLAGRIFEVDSRVDAVSRSLRVRARLPNSNAALKPGMAITVVLTFKGEPRPQVSSLAIQWDRNGPYVWKIVDGAVRRTDVDIVGRRSGAVAVLGDVAPGELVVVEGLQRLREGGVVQVVESGTSSSVASGVS